MRPLVVGLERPARPRGGKGACECHAAVESCLRPCALPGAPLRAVLSWRMRVDLTHMADLTASRVARRPRCISPRSRQCPRGPWSSILVAREAIARELRRGHACYSCARNRRVAQPFSRRPCPRARKRVPGVPRFARGGLSQSAPNRPWLQPSTKVSLYDAFLATPFRSGPRKDMGCMAHQGWEAGGPRKEREKWWQRASSV